MMEIALSKAYSEKDMKEIQKIFSEAKVSVSLDKDTPEAYIDFRDSFGKTDRGKIKEVLKKLAAKKAGITLEIGKKTAFLGIVENKQIEKAIDNVEDALKKSKKNCLFFSKGEWSEEVDWSSLA